MWSHTIISEQSKSAHVIQKSYQGHFLTSFPWRLLESAIMLTRRSRGYPEDFAVPCFQKKYPSPERILVSGMEVIWSLVMTSNWSYRVNIRIWHNVKACLDQSFWQIYQKLMLSGGLQSFMFSNSIIWGQTYSGTHWTLAFGRFVKNSGLDRSSHFVKS